MNRVLVLLARGFEEIEAVTVVDVLRRANVEVTTASMAAREVPGSRGIPVVADAVFTDVAGKYDVAYLPGGVECMQRLASDPRVGDFLKAHLEGGGKLAAICAAPFVLHAHGLIPRGARITSHPSVADDLKAYDYLEDRVVRDGSILTSRGPGTAMEFALTLAEELAGPDVRSELEAAMLTAKS